MSTTLLLVAKTNLNNKIEQQPRPFGRGFPFQRQSALLLVVNPPNHQRKSASTFFNYFLKHFRIAYGNIGQHFSVKPDVGFF